MEFASKGLGVTGATLGGVGTGLSVFNALGGNGILGNLLGINGQ